MTTPAPAPAVDATARLDYLHARLTTIAKLRREHGDHAGQMAMYADQADRVLDEALLLDPHLKAG